MPHDDTDSEPCPHCGGDNGNSVPCCLEEERWRADWSADDLAAFIASMWGGE